MDNKEVCSSSLNSKEPSLETAPQLYNLSINKKVPYFQKYIDSASSRLPKICKYGDL